MRGRNVSSNQHPSRDISRSGKLGSGWLRSAWIGYPASVGCIGVLLLLEKLDAFAPQAPIFVGSPFALLSILVALLWGMGSALVTMVLGLAAIATWIAPGILTPNLLQDLILDGPFLFLQLLAVVVVLHFERSRRKLVAARQAKEVAQRELERAMALKDAFILRASHELRTPLTTILGRTQWLSSRLQKSGQTPENWSALSRYLEVVEGRAQRLHALVDRLYQLGRLQTADLPLQRQPCDLGALCRQVVADQRHLSERVIELEVPDDAVMVQIDEELLRQVLENLLSNAIKYSPEPSAIGVSLSKAQGQATLQVHNESPALSAEQIEHLFEPFYRTAEVEASSIPGWGLGLSICKEIVERYEGRIWAQSRAGEGVTFFVRLALAV